MRPTYCPLFARFISLLMSAALLVSMLVVAPRSSAKSPRKAKSTAPVISPQGNSQRQRQPAPRCPLASRAQHSLASEGTLHHRPSAPKRANKLCVSCERRRGERIEYL